MVQLIVGNKGSGKTKTLIESVKKAAKLSKGHVICIERGKSLRYDLGHEIRLIDIKEYGVRGAECYYGFIAGLLAGNYDITEVFADATFKILCGKDAKDMDALAVFIEKVAELTKDGPNMTFTVSCDPHDLPESVKGFVID